MDWRNLTKQYCATQYFLSGYTSLSWKNLIWKQKGKWLSKRLRCTPCSFWGSKNLNPIFSPITVAKDVKVKNIYRNPGASSRLPSCRFVFTEKQRFFDIFAYQNRSPEYNPITYISLANQTKSYLAKHRGFLNQFTVPAKYVNKHRLAKRGRFRHLAPLLVFMQLTPFLPRDLLWFKCTQLPSKMLETTFSAKLRNPEETTV